MNGVEPLDPGNENPCGVSAVWVGLVKEVTQLSTWKADLLLLSLSLGTRPGLVPCEDLCGGGRRTASNSTHPVLLKTLQRPGPPSTGC